MEDEIEIHYDSKRGLLTLTCGPDSFAKLREIVFAEASVSEIVGPISDGARVIQIEVVSR